MLTRENLEFVILKNDSRAKKDFLAVLESEMCIEIDKSPKMPFLALDHVFMARVPNFPLEHLQNVFLS